MTATYADDESTSGSGSEERKATSAWTCEVSEETRGTSLLTVASSNHEGLDAGGVAPRRTEESPRSMKIEEDSRSDSVVSIEGSYVFVPRVRSDCSSVENFEDEKGEEKMGSSGNCEGDGEQVSTIKTEGNKSQRKISNEMDLPTRNEDTVKKKTSLYEETIESDDRRSSVEDLCRSIEKELMVNEETKRFSPKKIIVTCGPFVTSSNNIACRIIGDDEKDEEVAEVEDYTKDESYDPEIGLDFHEAVRAGDAQRVATLLADNRVQNLDEPDWNVSGDPPLLVAATNHSLPVLNILLENGCDPGVRSPRGETALHRVILNGGPGNVLNFVEELLKYDCPAGVKEAGGGLTALHVLTRQLAHAQSSKSLHHDFEAALKTLDLLAKAGPINAKDHQGRSALHILASSTIFDNNHKTEIESLMETLLAAGANPALKNDRGETPLHECLECGALNTASLLIPHTPPGIMSRYGETPLHIASRKNYVDMVAKLLEHGEDPSVQDAGGNTPLHLASARGFHRTVSLLITSPLAQLEKTNLDGLTALQVAAESGFVNAVRLLLKAGADPSQTVHYCTTTLHRHPDISILIDHELTRRRQLAA